MGNMGYQLFVLLFVLCLLEGAAVEVRTRRGEDAILTCTVPSATTLVWDREGVTGALAIGGVVQVSQLA